MDSPTIIPDTSHSQVSSPSYGRTRRRRSLARARRKASGCSTNSSSPEFEFCMVRNPNSRQPDLLSADELFSGGFLLPLHLLSLNIPDPEPRPDSEPTSVNDIEPNPSTVLHRGSEPLQDQDRDLDPTTLEPAPTGPRRFRNIFKKNEKKTATEKCQVLDHTEKPKVKKREKMGPSHRINSSAELNINIWPFSRSRSAGNAPTRSMVTVGAPTTRKVNSAPCSRSNSASENKSRKWPNSPNRAGIHLGRTNPIWHMKRSGSMKGSDPVNRGTGKGVATKEEVEVPQGHGVASRTKPRLLNFNVPMCLGYAHTLSCRSDDDGASNVATPTIIGDGGCSYSVGGRSSDATHGGNVFNLRNLFSKRVY